MISNNISDEVSEVIGPNSFAPLFEMCVATAKQNGAQIAVVIGVNMYSNLRTPTHKKKKAMILGNREVKNRLTNQ
ncbi:hypothetical protein O9992_05205 [Vibrio lentus]|nr:hypothetical protein [Vibrio lentus]